MVLEEIERGLNVGLSDSNVITLGRSLVNVCWLNASFSEAVSPGLTSEGQGLTEI